VNHFIRSLNCREALIRIAERSDCDKIKFGAVALNENGTILAYGWNHNPRPRDGYSCARDCVGGIRAGVRSGTCVERCYSVHAEQHALLESRWPVDEIAVLGVMPDGRLFDNGGGFYCTVCARLMAAAGVKRVWVLANDDWQAVSIEDAWRQSYEAALR
jgi:deoxycytidylate deaminase